MEPIEQPCIEGRLGARRAAGCLPCGVLASLGSQRPRNSLANAIPATKMNEPRLREGHHEPLRRFEPSATRQVGELLQEPIEAIPHELDSQRHHSV